MLNDNLKFYFQLKYSNKNKDKNKYVFKHMRQGN